MKNIFKSLVASAALLAVSTASAGTLYWQASSESGTQFESAWLVAEAKEGGAKEYLDAVDSQAPGYTSTLVTQTSLDSLSDPDAYLFYVEMCNYNSTSGDYDVVETGYKYGYGDLVSSGYVATGAIDANSAKAAAAAGNIAAVPEPSSGLLLLMGGALLALRRRRQK